MARAGHARPAVALAALALAGCAGGSYVAAPPANLAAPRLGAAPGESVPSERAAEATPRAAAPRPERAPETTRRVAGAPPPASPSAAVAVRREDASAPAVSKAAAARGGARPASAPDGVLGEPATDSVSIRPPADPAGALPSVPPALSGTEAPEAPEDDPAGGGVGVWFLGVLLAGGIAGGGWLALQPKWVRRRTWRALRAVPGRILARIRGARAAEPAGTTAWKSAPPTWVVSDDAPPGLGGPLRRKRRPRGKLTDATLPAFRAAGQDDPDGPSA